MLPGKAVLKAFGLAPVALPGSPTAERALTPLQTIAVALCTCTM